MNETYRSKDTNVNIVNSMSKRKHKPVRRSKMNLRVAKEIKIVYSNIQGFIGKKTSITEIMEALECDICLLTETMTTNVKLEGLKCITAAKSIGQNVAIVLRKKMNGLPVIKLYEPNDTINMMGIRIETAKNNYQRIYTAHLKQTSTNSKDIIRAQFQEIVNQFRQATMCQEGMVLVCDANVHVGGAEIPRCEDVQDWAGGELASIIRAEGLHLLNSKKLCEGVVTRVDPRNGTRTTIDLAICNEFIIDKIQNMKIDEEELFRPTNYKGTKTTKTDHNTIIIQLKVKKVAIKEQVSYFNTKSEEGMAAFKEKMQSTDLDHLFVNVQQLGEDYRKLTDIWNEAMRQSFEKVKKSKNRKSGIDDEVKELVRKKYYGKEAAITIK